MKAATRYTMRAYDLGSKLRFHLERERGWIELVVVPVVLIYFASLAYVEHSWIWVGLVFIGAGSIVADRLRGRSVSLTVSADLFFAKGNTGRFFSGEVSIPAAEITSFGYLPGGEDDPAGFYVSRTWRNSCLIPELSESDCHQIREEISNRFPQIGSAEEGPGLSVFTERSLPVTLDLSERQ